VNIINPIAPNATMRTTFLQITFVCISFSILF
jgi:hypothetical protein